MFLAFIFLAMIASTIYDLYLQKYLKGKRMQLSIPLHFLKTLFFTVPKHKILLAFSVYSNGKKIIKVNTQTEQILFFNGLKVVSMFWVVLGHRFESNEVMAVNKADIIAVQKLESILVFCS